MYKYTALIVCFIFFVVRNNAFAQDDLKKYSEKDTRTYNIKSLDGKDEQIRIMPDYSNHNLRISYKTDTLKINDFWGVPVETHLLNESFIEITIVLRTGSNEGRKNMMIFCIDKNKLCEAMSIRSASNYDYGNYYGRGIYYIKVLLKGNNKENYRLIADVYDNAHSRKKPQTNYNYHSQTVLSYDVNQDIFYSIKDFVYGTFTIYDAKTNKPYKFKIKDYYPMMILGKKDYYFLKGEWYEIEGNELSKDSFITRK